jgi:beta-xylosidase
MGRATRLVTGGLAALIAMAGIAAVIPPASAQSSTFTTPAYQGDFPDPAVILVGGTYWAYSTGSAGRNLQVMSSPDLHTWSAPVDPLPKLPAWAAPGLTWAPGVINAAGTYLMYYTVHDPSLAHQCISVATSSTPGGPFMDTSSGPLLCQSSNGGSIDPNPYLDPSTGQLVLMWKSDDNSIGQTTHLWGQPLTAGGLSFAPGTSPTLLLSQTASWQSPAIEGPAVVKNGNRYYLFYSANNYASASSGIGYAVSSSLLGRYSNQSWFGPWLGSRGNATGPQGPWVFSDASGATRLAFAAWDGPIGYNNGGARSLWVATLTFRRGSPQAS